MFQYLSIILFTHVEDEDAEPAPTGSSHCRKKKWENMYRRLEPRITNMKCMNVTLYIYIL